MEDRGQSIGNTMEYEWKIHDVWFCWFWLMHQQKPSVSRWFSEVHCQAEDFEAFCSLLHHILTLLDALGQNLCGTIFGLQDGATPALSWFIKSLNIHLLVRYVSHKPWNSAICRGN